VLQQEPNPALFGPSVAESKSKVDKMLTLPLVQPPAVEYGTIRAGQIEFQRRARLASSPGSLVGAADRADASGRETVAISDDSQMTVAVIGSGEMGSAVGRRLREMGARAVTELNGRSRRSIERVAAAGLEVIDDDRRLAAEADYILSIVPPGVAYEVAERFYGPLQSAARNPVFVECNAVSPATVRRIGQLLRDTGCRFVDAGIIGGPPAGTASKGPRFYASGPHAQAFARLARYGLDIAVLDGPVGAASGLKLCYAGLTKGFIALAQAMVGAAVCEGLAESLFGELARTQPDMLARFEHSVPGTFSKAYRWVAEMEQIAEFLGDEPDGAGIYRGAARLYERIAMEFSDSEPSQRLAAIEALCRKRH
jgi:L-threonate 2-dehydrogenase